MLPQKKSPGTEKALIQQLEEFHGISLTSEAILALDRFISRIPSRRFIPYDGPVEIINGKGAFGLIGGILGVAAAAVFTGGLSLSLAATAFAIGSTVGTLVGSLFRKRSQEENFTPLATISSGAQLASIGDVVPVVYGKRDRNNPAGGVRVENPIIIYSEIRSRNGLQQLTTVYLLSKGELEEISSRPEDLLINDQPINEVLLDDEYQIVITNGLPNATKTIVSYSSQTIEVSVSNNVGARLTVRREAISNVSGDTITFESPDTLSNLAPSDRLAIPGNNTEENFFRLVSRNRNNSTATFSQDVTNGNIFALASASYKSTRNIDRLTVNLSIDLWERNQDGDLKEKSVAFDLYIQPESEPETKIGTFGCRGRNPSGSVRSFELRSLRRKKVKIRLQPRLNPTGTVRTIGETGPLTVQTIQGFEIAFQEETNFSNAEKATYQNIDKNSQYSFDQNYPITITSVNEIVLDGLKAYPGFAVLKLIINANERITSEPRVSVLIPGGRKVKNLLAAGFATANANSLHDVSQSFTSDDISTDDFVFNLETNETYNIRSVSQSQILLDGNPRFSNGDRYLIYRLAASPFFQDTAIDLLTDPDVRATLNIEPFEICDLPAFVEARKWNQQKKYYWDNTVATEQTFGEWFSDNCASVLCLPVTQAGRLSIIPERDDDPVTLYTPANMLEGQPYQESWVPLTEAAFNRIVVTFRDGSDRLMQQISVTLTEQGATSFREQVLDTPSIHSLDQAIDYGALVLQSNLKQNKTFSWATDLDGLDSFPGAAVLIGVPTIRYLGNRGGFIAEVNGSQFKPSLNLGAGFITVETSDRLIEDLELEVLGNNWFTASGYDNPVVGDRFVYGFFEELRNKVRITRQSIELQENTVQLSANLLPSDMFGTDGLDIEKDVPAGTLLWDFDGTDCFQSYEGEHQTEALCRAAAQGFWTYNPNTLACEQVPSLGQHRSQLICDQIWSQGHLDCPHGNSAPATGNQFGLIAKLGAGPSHVNPQGVSVFVNYFTGFGEQPTAKLTNRLFNNSTDSPIVVTEDDPAIYLIAEFPDIIIKESSDIRLYTDSGGIAQVFIATSLPRNYLPAKYEENGGWTDLGEKTFTGSALNWDTPHDFSVIRIIFKHSTGMSNQLRAIDIYRESSILARSSYRVPDAIVTGGTFNEDPPASGIGSVTVTGQVPTTACGSYQMSFYLMENDVIIAGPENYPGPFVGGDPQSHTFTNVTSATYTAHVDLTLI